MYRPKHGLSAAERKQFLTLVRRLLKTRAGRAALARWVKQPRPAPRGHRRKITADDAVGPLMLHVASLAKQQGLPETATLAMLVNALPERLRSWNVKSDSEWRRIYNKGKCGKLPELPPAIRKIVGVKVVKRFDEP